VILSSQLTAARARAIIVDSLYRSMRLFTRTNSAAYSSSGSFVRFTWGRFDRPPDLTPRIVAGIRAHVGQQQPLVVFAREHRPQVRDAEWQHVPGVPFPAKNICGGSASMMRTRR